MNKKVFSILFALLLLLTSLTNKVDADTKYQVFVDEGLYGSVNKVAEVPEGAVLGFGSEAGSDSYIIYDQSDLNKVYYRITSTDEKYYVKGIHISGHYLDADELLKNSDNLTVEEDLYLVASYGVKGEQYSYQVYYFTEDGTNLMTATGETDDHDTFYAYKDEKVIVGSRFFDGYEDYIVVRGHWKDSETDRTEATRGFSFTGTIKENGTIIEYYYRQIVPGEEITYDETVIYVPGEGGVTGGGGGGAAPATPVEPIIDIDEPEVPQTEPVNPEPSDNQGDNQPDVIIEPEKVPTSFWEEFFSKPWLVGGTGIALAMLIFFLTFLFKRRKNEEQ